MLLTPLNPYLRNTVALISSQSKSSDCDMLCLQWQVSPALTSVVVCLEALEPCYKVPIIVLGIWAPSARMHRAPSVSWSSVLYLMEEYVSLTFQQGFLFPDPEGQAKWTLFGKEVQAS